MSEQETAIRHVPGPANTAIRFMGMIQDIERNLERNEQQIASIENRGLLDNLFTPSRNDLIELSRGNNAIQTLTLGLIQEAISLNTMSYAYLAAVVSEMEQRSRDGWVDNEGQLQRLSTTGQAFATQAREIFVGILDGSKSTQRKIAENREAIDTISEELTRMMASQEQQGEQMDAQWLGMQRFQSKLQDYAQQLCQQDAQIEQLHDSLQQQGMTLQHLERGQQTLEQGRTEQQAHLEQQAEQLKTLNEQWQTHQKAQTRMLRKHRYAIGLLGMGWLLLAGLEVLHLGKLL